MKYLVYMKNEFLSPQTIIVVSANNFVIAKGYIIFVKGFRKVSLFNVERVEKVLQE